MCGEREVNSTSSIQGDSIDMAVKENVLDLLKIKEGVGGLYSVLLPPCDVSILRLFLTPEVGYVWLLDYNEKELFPWIENHLPLPFNKERKSESVVVRNLEIDVSLETKEFLKVLPSFLEQGIDLVHAPRSLPRNLHIRGLKPESIGKTFHRLGVLFEFFIPHPHEYAQVTSPSLDKLRSLIASFYKSVGGEKVAQ